MNIGTLKSFVAGLTLVSFTALPVMAAGPAAGPVEQVGLFSTLTKKKGDDCAKDAKKVAEKKSADAKKAGCDNGGDSDGCNLLQRALERTDLGRRLADDGLRVSGYLQAGYHSDSNGQVNSHPDDLNLHQMYLAIEKLANEAKVI